MRRNVGRSESTVRVHKLAHIQADVNTKSSIRINKNNPGRGCQCCEINRIEKPSSRLFGFRYFGEFVAAPARLRARLAPTHPKIHPLHYFNGFLDNVNSSTGRSGLSLARPSRNLFY